LSELSPQATEADRRLRQLRYRFYVVGSAFAVAGMAMGTMPVFTQRTPILVAKGCALVGAVILAIGRFTPDHVLARLVSRK
jgi:hypothetical protein